MSAAPAPVPSPFDEWGRITRFLESARLAFTRERTLWTTLGIAHPGEVEISAVAAASRRYRVRLEQHLAAVADHEMLYASVLVHSYAVAEAAAGDRLGVDPRALGPVEEWGTRLLSCGDRGWADVKDGSGGVVEVAVVRNAFAHGTRVVDERSAQRLLAAGVTHRPVGSAVTLEYEELRLYRARLLSLLQVSRLGYTPTGDVPVGAKASRQVG